VIVAGYGGSLSNDAAGDTVGNVYDAIVHDDRVLHLAPSNDYMVSDARVGTNIDTAF
jgi:hypothetical protein